MKTKNMTILHLRKSIGRSPLRLGFLLIGLALALAWFALSPPAQAVTPPPDGGYFGFNTAEGAFALNSLTPVFTRSFSTRPAAATRPPVAVRSHPTRPASTTRPPVVVRSEPTQPAISTRPSVLLRSISTQPAPTTRPSVLLRSMATQPAATTRAAII